MTRPLPETVAAFIDWQNIDRYRGVGVAVRDGVRIRMDSESDTGVADGVGASTHDALFVAPARSARLSLIRSISSSPALQGCPHTPQLNARTTPASATVASSKVSRRAIDPSSAIKNLQAGCGLTHLVILYKNRFVVARLFRIHKSQVIRYNDLARSNAAKPA